MRKCRKLLKYFACALALATLMSVNTAWAATSYTIDESSNTLYIKGDSTLISSASTTYDDRSLSNFDSIKLCATDASGIRTWSGRFDLSDTDLYITVTGETTNTDAVYLSNYSPYLYVNNFYAKVDSPASDAINISHDASKADDGGDPTVWIKGNLEATVSRGNGIRANASTKEGSTATIIVDGTTNITLKDEGRVSLIGEDGTISVGDNNVGTSLISAVYAGDSMYYLGSIDLGIFGTYTIGTETKGQAEITLNGAATLTTYGDGDYGILAGKNGTIYVNDNLTIDAWGSDAYGIVAKNTNITYTDLADISSNHAGSYVYLSGDENVITMHEGGYALYASGMNAEGGSNTIASGDEGIGYLEATGDVLAEEGGLIDLTVRDYLSVTGDISAKSSGVVNITGTAVLNGNALADGEGSEITFSDNFTGGDEENPALLEALNGGTITVNATEEGTVTYTGTTSVDDTSILDMYLTSGSAWYLTGSSSATNLGNSGLIDMTADGGAFSTLTLDTLSGTGSILMDVGTDGEDAYNNSDIIYVEGENDAFTGQQNVELTGAAVSGLNLSQDAVGTVLLVSSSGDGTVTLANDYKEGTLFWQKYEISTKEGTAEGTTDHYISSISYTDPDVRETTSVSTAMSAAALNYHTWMMQNTKMLQRLGDLRLGAHDKDEGVWFRVSGSKLELGGEHGFGNKYMEYQAGYDKIIDQTEEKTTYGGIAFTYADGDSSYRRGSGDNESYAASLYLTQIRDSGSYLDLVFKLGRWKNDFTVYNTYGNLIKGETESAGISLSAELGKKFALNENGFYIEPQAQLTYGHLAGDTYTLSNGVDVHSESIDSLAGRVGFNLGWDINPRSNIYLKANVYNEFLGDYGVTLTDATGRIHRSGDYGDTWFTYGLGGTFQLGNPKNGTYLYFDIERSAGGDLDQDWYYNVGFRFSV